MLKTTQFSYNLTSESYTTTDDDIVGMAIQPVVCQTYDSHRNSDFQNSQKLDPLQMPAKKFKDKMY
jgi:hypothetical protein